MRRVGLTGNGGHTHVLIYVLGSDCGLRQGKKRLASGAKRFQATGGHWCSRTAVGFCFVPVHGNSLRAFGTSAQTVLASLGRINP